MFNVFKFVQALAVALATWLTLWDYAPDWARQACWQVLDWADWVLRLVAAWVGPLL